MVGRSHALFFTTALRGFQRKQRGRDMVLETVLIEFLAWCVLTIGAAFIVTLLWIGKKLGERLSAIETQIGETNKMLGVIELDLRKDIGRHSSEIDVLYSRCSANHGSLRRSGDRECS